MICKSFCGELPPPPPLPPPSAGEIEFGNVENQAVFVFTSGAEEEPIDFAEITLDPASRDFESPSPGILQYTGDSQKTFRLSWSTVFLWSDGTVPETAFLLVPKRNDESVIPAIQAQNASVGNIISLSSSTMLVLNPGDNLQLFISSINSGETFTLNFLALSLFANEV